MLACVFIHRLGVEVTRDERRPRSESVCGAVCSPKTRNTESCSQPSRQDGAGVQVQMCVLLTKRNGISGYSNAIPMCTCIGTSWRAKVLSSALYELWIRCAVSQMFIVVRRIVVSQQRNCWRTAHQIKRTRKNGQRATEQRNN